MNNVNTIDNHTKIDKTLQGFAKELEGRPPAEILEWAISNYGERLTFATGFGAEGCVLIDLIGRHQLTVDLFTLDTGVLFEETYALWEKLEQRYGLKIRGVTPDSNTETPELSRLWERDPDQCCSLRKVIPLQSELKKVDAWITAIRRDQTPQRATASVVEKDDKFGIAKVNPLVSWTKQDVWKYLYDFRVPYNPLHDRGFPSIGCWPCTSPTNPGEEDRAGRWRGISKTECGLHETVVLAD